jgi:L-ascorbate metabolism protein UlaG (beta-lactamase superfamily)
MSDKAEYLLGRSTILEPLLNNWAVWSDLISPAPYSMHLLHYQIKTLSSYLTNPEIHLKACRNPKFTGGPFVDHPVERVPEIKQLLEQMEREQSANIEFARAITDAYELLSKEAKGQSLDRFYEKLPVLLRGYSELLYDYYNHPILRLNEGLLYESEFYRRDLQSMRVSSTVRDDSRRFFLSTPRLPDDREVDWRIPFESSQLDEFFTLEDTARPLGEIRELLGLSEDDTERLLPLLTKEQLAPRESWDGAAPRIRYLGHACVLVQWNGISVMTDPWIGVRPEEGGIERIAYQDLPDKIDFALITHAHHDHFVPETLLRLRHKIDCLVVPRTHGLFYTDTSLKLMAKKLGFRNVMELDSLESIKVADGEIIAVPFLGEHADLPHGKTAYVIRAGNERFLFAADSNCLDQRLYEHLRKILGDIETVFLGMECVGAPLSWLYGALLPSKLNYNQDQTRRTKGSDSKAALALLEAVGAKRVFIYAMGNEPWFQYSMGLGLSEESQQIKEANKVISIARERGFLEAGRPFGCLDLTFGHHHNAQKVQTVSHT